MYIEHICDFLSQSLEEPGEECTRFDSIVPTVVHPPSSAEGTDEEMMELGILRQFTFSSDLQVYMLGKIYVE